MAELRKDYEVGQEELARERDQSRRLVNAEKRDAAAAKDKLTAQMTRLKTAAEQERESWTAKERHYLQQLDEMSDSHLEAMQQQKVQDLIYFSSPTNFTLLII